MDQIPEPELFGVTGLENQETLESSAGPVATKTWAALVLVVIVGLLAVQMTGRSDEAGDETETEAHATDRSDSPITTSVHSNDRVFVGAAPDLEPGDRFFDYDTGWDVIVGGWQTKMLRIPLDGGDLGVGRPGTMPIIAIDDWLIVSSTAEAHRIISLSDPDLKETVFDGLTAGFAGARPGPESNQVWLSTDPYDVWQLWELSDTPRLLREVAAGQRLFNGPSQDPELYASIAGGVFAGSPDSPVKVAEGRLVAASPVHAIVQECSSPFDCEINWLSRSTWQVDPSVQPPSGFGTDGWARVLASPDKRHVYLQDQTLFTLWDLETGVAVEEDLQGNGAFSSDGRFFAAVNFAGRLFVMDFETGQSLETPGDWLSGFSQVVLVPSPG